MRRKILLAIADGLGDRPCKILENKTPLEYAKTKTLDKLAEIGVTGIMDLYRPGTPVGTDLGHLILFGYGKDDYPGRGPIEAFGKKIELLAGDVVFRCNFATINEEMKIIDRRAGRIREGTNKLAEALNGMEIDGVKIIFKEGTEHRAVMVFRGNGLSADISDTDPKKELLKIKKSTPKINSNEAEFTANILNKFIEKAHEILKNHPLNSKRIKEGKNPANCIVTRGAGKMNKIEKITEKLNFTAACIAAEDTVLGVARIAGFKAVTDKSFTGNIDTNIQKKAELTLKELKNNDFVVLHYKATDLMGHDNNPIGKVNAIEKYDKMIELVLNGFNDEEKENIIIALAADHSTPCERREHSGEPVPILISGKSIRRDNINRYNEISCSQGGLNRIKGADFINILLDYLEVTIKEGN